MTSNPAVGADRKQEGESCCPRAFIYRGEYPWPNGSLKDEFITKAIRIHGNVYDYSLVEYTNNSTKVSIRCSKHGIFTQTPAVHLQPSGCPVCGVVNGGSKKAKSSEQIIKDFTVIHGNRYDYSNVRYQSRQHNVTIICPTHGAFLQSPNTHLKGGHCPKCRSSKGVHRIREVLQSMRVDVIEEYTFNGACRNPKTDAVMRFDFYLPLYNTCIEFDGIQHFKPTKFRTKLSEREVNLNFGEQQFRDDVKNKFCVNRRVTLIRIRYDQVEHIESILLDHISSTRI